MKPNQELHQLIKSLSKTEKTYFKKFASRHYKQNNTSIKLFNELERKNINGLYAEDDIKSKFKDEIFISQLPVTKNYLYNNILKSLNLYYTEDNIEIKLSSLINSAIILYRKELFPHCLKLINKAKMLAQRFDKPSKLLEAIHIERQALRVNSSLNEVAGALMKNYDEEMEVLRKLKNISEYRKLYDMLVIYATAKGMSRDKESSAKLEKLTTHKLLKDIKHAQYFQSRVLFMLIHCFTNNLKGEHKTSYKYGEKTLELIGDSDDNKMIAAYEYVLALQEMMLSASFLDKPEESEIYYKRLIAEQDKLVKHAPDKVKNFLKMRTLTCMLNINAGHGSYEANLDVIKELLALSKKNEGSSYRDEVLVTNFLAAVTYFGLSRYDDSLFFLNKIFNSKAFELREDIQISCRILNLILHYELGHMGSLEYYVKSTYRYLKKRNRLSRFEKLVFEFIKKSQSISTEKELFQLFKSMKHELKILGEAYEELSMIQLLELSSWLDSKLRNKPYIEVLKENMKKTGK
jgi:hypothetical protein